MNDDLDSLKFDLDNLKKLHIDLEKQMLKFDEVVPYERQRTAHIYSPRLLNMMLVCGAQIEAVARLIARRCNFEQNQGGIPALIREIDQKTVLAKFRIISIPHQLLVTPFGGGFSWWNAYNELKHDLKEKQFKITYTTVMDAFSALAALHCLADNLMKCFDKDIPQVLDSTNWIYDDYYVKVNQIERNLTVNRFWRSLLFEIQSLYKPS